MHGRPCLAANSIIHRGLSEPLALKGSSIVVAACIPSRCRTVRLRILSTCSRIRYSPKRIMASAHELAPNASSSRDRSLSTVRCETSILVAINLFGMPVAESSRTFCCRSVRLSRICRKASSLQLQLASFLMLRFCSTSGIATSTPGSKVSVAVRSLQAQGFRSLRRCANRPWSK